MISAAHYSSLIIAFAALVMGLFKAGHPLAAATCAGFGALWLLALIIRWKWISDAGFPLLILAAAAGLWLGAPFGWMLAAVLGGLAAWDLNAFTHRLRFSAAEDDRKGLAQRHLRRLGIVLLVGIMLSIWTMFLRLRFTFEWAVVLVIAGIYGISRLIRWLSRGREGF